ncbi:MAG: hypothetical protein N2510_07185 [Ignavibacteria bacterium]|nr:hypothetical protein [Ignavibacteria bacterium]
MEKLNKTPIRRISRKSNEEPAKTSELETFEINSVDDMELEINIKKDGQVYSIRKTLEMTSTFVEMKLYYIPLRLELYIEKLNDIMYPDGKYFPEDYPEPL